MSHIAFIGTGLLGSAFAEAAARRGDQVTAWNRSPEKAAALAELGVRALPTPGEAVRDARRIHLVLKDDAVVEEVVASFRADVSPDAVIIDHTTTLPTLTAERSTRFNGEGLHYLHCPVFMGPPAARNSQGSMMVSGPNLLFQRVKADLARMTGKLEYLGERPGLAAVPKLCGNAVIIGMIGALADVLAIARESSVAPEDAVKLMGLLDLNAMVAGRGTLMAKGNFTASFELAMARKDVGLMLSAAGGHPMAVLPSIAERIDQRLAEGFGAADLCVIGKLD